MSEDEEVMGQIDAIHRLLTEHLESGVLLQLARNIAEIEGRTR
jgi:hypothetical protein